MARENPDTTTRRTFIVRRDGANGELLPTPKTDDDLSETASSRRGVSVRLHINVDHVATLRNARGTPYPDPVDAAEMCLAAGADGITAHLREDRRHIVDEDVDRLRALLRGACAARSTSRWPPPTRWWRSRCA